MKLRKYFRITLFASVVSTAANTHAESPSTAPTFPINHTITDAQGRKMEVVITGKTETSVKITRKSDNKEFELPLDKLSKEDQMVVEHLTTKMPKLLFLQYDEKKESLIIQKLKTAGFEITIAKLDDQNNGGAQHFRYTSVEKMTAEEFNSYQIIWSTFLIKPITERMQAGNGFPGAKELPTVLVFRDSNKTPITDFLDGKSKQRDNCSPYVISEKKVVRYLEQTSQYISKGGRYELGAVQPEIYDKTIEEIKKSSGKVVVSLVLLVGG